MCKPSYGFKLLRLDTLQAVQAMALRQALGGAHARVIHIMVW